MILRCTDPKSHNFHRYGERGISVCRQWENFDTFYEEMGPKPFKGAQIERIDNNGNYEQLNCRWATAKEQANNRRTNHSITFNGQTKTIAQWAEELQMKHSTISLRLKRGWPPEKALRGH